MTAAALVAEIRDRYTRTNADKLVIQKDMVELRDEHNWTQRRIADETGVPHSTVTRWLQAYDESLAQVGQAKLTPASEQARSDRAVARRVIAENPEIVAEAIEAVPHEDRVEIATRILDPATRSGRLLAQTAYDQDGDKRRRRREHEEQSRADKALPLPAYMAKMVVQMNEWTLGLAALVDDLDDLPDGRGLELVADAARKLAEQAQRWVDRCDRKPNLRVIEGKALREELVS